MGYTRHHAVMVTAYGFAAKELEAAHALAIDLGCHVSPISEPVMNDWQSFAVFPDGSKEGWELSDQHDKARADLIAHLEGTFGLIWCEVQYGDDYGDNRMLRSGARTN